MRPVRRRIALAFASMAIAFTASPVIAQTQARSGIVQATSDFPVSPPARTNSRLFYLSVPEHRSDPESRLIELPIAVLPSQAQAGESSNGSARESKTPVIMLAGGPGTAGMSAAQYPGAYPWVGERDFIVFGQRGTHHARPALMCEDYAKALGDKADQPTQIDAVTNCAEQAQANRVDLGAYNTAESARDIEDLRTALGTEKLILYGLSYGTRLALSYARQFPSRVEALVLDSPLPFSADYDHELPSNLEAALKTIASRCAMESQCNASYPYLWQRFSAAMAELTQRGSAQTGPSSAQIAFYIAPTTASEVSVAPMLMDAAARGDYSKFRNSLYASGSSDFAYGMRLSVWCSERIISGETPAPFAGIDAPTFSDEICNAWPVAPRPESELVDPEGDFPTLILAGEYDVLTPPGWGERLLPRLSRARLVTIPAGFHGVTTNWGGTGCAMSIAGSFVSAPKEFLEAPDLVCLAEEPHPEFSF